MRKTLSITLAALTLVTTIALPAAASPARAATCGALGGEYVAGAKPAKDACFVTEVGERSYSATRTETNRVAEAVGAATIANHELSRELVNNPNAAQEVWRVSYQSVTSQTMQDTVTYQRAYTEVHTRYVMHFQGNDAVNVPSRKLDGETTVTGFVLETEVEDAYVVDTVGPTVTCIDNPGQGGCPSFAS